MSSIDHMAKHTRCDITDSAVKYLDIKSTRLAIHFLLLSSVIYDLFGAQSFAISSK